MIKKKFIFLNNFKKILNFDLKKKKNSFIEYVKDLKNKYYIKRRKKKILIEIIKKIKKKPFKISQLFTLFFFSIKLGCFFFLAKLIFKNYLNNYCPENFWIILTLWEFEQKKKILLSRDIIFIGFLKNSSMNFLPKEYFRYKIFLAKLIFRYFNSHKILQNCKKIFMPKQNLFWLNFIFKKIIWSIFWKIKDFLFLENIYQISAKEMLNFHSIFFLGEIITDLIKMIIIYKINLIDNLKFVYIPKILTFDNTILKCISRKIFYIYLLIPKNKIFVNFNEKQKEKNFTKKFYVLNIRNQIQFYRIKFIVRKI
jgi:hypothetical protein